MKKVISLLLIISLFLFSACENESEAINTEAPAEEAYVINDAWRPYILNLFHDLYQPGDVSVFELSADDYFSFSENPSYDALHGHFEQITLYRKIESDQNPVECFYIYNNHAKVYLYPSGGMRASKDGRFPVYTETIDFLGNPSAVQRFLLEQNIEVEVVDVLVITTYEHPILIWVKCADRSLLMTWNEYFYEDIEAEGDVYRIYTPQEYTQKLIEEYNITPPS